MLAGTICLNDHDCPIRMDVYDARKPGNHILLGSAQFTLIELLENRRNRLEVVANERRSCVVKVVKCLAR